MKLSRHSKVIRYAFFLSAERYSLYRRKQISLCELFWRCVGTTIALSFLVFLMFVTLSLVVRNPRPAASGLGIAALVIGILELCQYVRRQFRGRHEEPTLLQTAYHAVKDRFCPFFDLMD